MHLGRTGDARALDHREPDGAAADHPHARARPDLRGLEHRADAGRDRAADQAGLDERNAVDADRGALVHNRARGEGPRAERAGQGATVGEPHAGPGGGRRSAAAQVAARAPAALAARRAPADHDPVAHAHGLDSGPDGLDDTRAFVPEQDRRRVGERRSRARAGRCGRRRSPRRGRAPRARAGPRPRSRRARGRRAPRPRFPCPRDELRLAACRRSKGRSRSSPAPGAGSAASTRSRWLVPARRSSSTTSAARSTGRARTRLLRRRS